MAPHTLNTLLSKNSGSPSAPALPPGATLIQTPNAPPTPPTYVYNVVTLTAGYQNGNKGTIFSGAIYQFNEGRERNVDSYLEIFAADGDAIYNGAVVAQTVPAGTTPAQQLATLAQAGNIPLAANAEDQMLGGIVLPRGKVMFGMMKAELSKLAANNGVRWSIQGGVMTLVPVTGYLPGQAVQINSATGMIGTPVLLGGRRNRHPLLHQLKHKNWPTGADQPGRDQSVGSDQPEPISHGGRRTLLPGRYYAGWLLSCPGHRLRGRYPRERLVQRTHLPSGRPLGSGRPASSGSQLRQRKSLPFSPLTVSATCLDGDVSSRLSSSVLANGRAETTPPASVSN